MSNELCWLSAVELTREMRARRVSPVEVLEAVLAQIDRVNPRVNAFVTRADESARRKALEIEAALARGEPVGPLAGVPIGVKDLHLTAGLRTTLGSRLYENFVPQFDHLIVSRLKHAGAIVIGKTNTSEFGLIPLTCNSVFGDTCNPWGTNFNAGGSSGGSAVAVACGMGPLATASDGGGSIRVPAAFTGVFGLKPQLGRIAHVAFPRGWEDLAHQGFLSRTVRDTALALDAVAGPDPRDRRSLPAPGKSYLADCTGETRGLRLAWCARLGRLPVDAEVLRITEGTAARFAELGATVESVELDLPDLGPAQQQIVLCEIAAALGDVRDAWQPLAFPANRKVLEQAARLTADDFMRAQWARDEYAEKLMPWFERYDALLTPAVPITAPANGTLGPKSIEGEPPRALSWLGHVIPFNMTGQPAASIPAGFAASGLPVGLQLVARPFDEGMLLRLASAYEAAFPWTVRRPPVVEPAA